MSPGKYEAQILAESYCTQVNRFIHLIHGLTIFYGAMIRCPCPQFQDVKDVINCIGGVHVLFPLLETAAAGSEEDAVDTGYLSLRDHLEHEPLSRRGSVEQEGSGGQGAASEEKDWELLPSSSFSDWKLEQNAISGM